LIIEDCCILIYPTACGPAQKERNEITSAFLLSKGLDPEIGSHLQSILEKTGVFEDIYVHEERLRFTPLTDGMVSYFREIFWVFITELLIDATIRPLAQTMRNSVIKTTTQSASAALVAAGMTPELQVAWEQEMNDEQYDPVQRFFFVWGRKRGMKPLCRLLSMLISERS
jgi:hypothetical protein